MQIEAYRIEIEEQERKGRAYLAEPADAPSEMTFNITGASMIIIDHTEVDDSLRGKGVGRMLLDKMVERARAMGWKILPLCPFARSHFDKDPSIADVLR